MKRYPLYVWILDFKRRGGMISERQQITSTAIFSDSEKHWTNMYSNPLT